MLIEIPYNRRAAVAYARRWAYSRNPAFYDFEELGGDCTNFASQCIYAGCGVMNYTPTFGWYYIDVNNRAPAWTGVEFLYNFLTSNTEAGPYAVEVSAEEVEPGDIIQLGDESGDFYHTPVVVAVRRGRIYVAAHSYDAYMRRLDSYDAPQKRYLHILGARKWIA